jgi:hypothetical protein
MSAASAVPKTADAITISFTNNYEQLIAALQRIERRAPTEAKDSQLSFEPVADWPLEKLTQSFSAGERPAIAHRVGFQLRELAGSLQSLLESRHCLCDAADSGLLGLLASRAVGLAIVASLEKMVSDVPDAAQWVPVAACKETIHRIRTEPIAGVHSHSS